jgi:hypothetical protein
MGALVSQTCSIFATFTMVQLCAYWLCPACLSVCPSACLPACRYQHEKRWMNFRNFTFVWPCIVTNFFIIKRN